MVVEMGGVLKSSDGVDSVLSAQNGLLLMAAFSIGGRFTDPVSLPLLLLLAVLPWLIKTAPAPVTLLLLGASPDLDYSNVTQRSHEQIQKKKGKYFYYLLKLLLRKVCPCNTERLSFI